MAVTMPPRRLSVSRRYSIQSSLVDNMVENIREKQLERMSESLDSYNLEDVYETRSNEWLVKRFVLANKCDREDSAAALDKSLLWRKSSGVTESRSRDFPKELVQSGLITFGTDQAGHRVLFFRTKVLSSSGLCELSDMVLKYLMHVVLNLESKSEGLAIVFDMSDTSILRPSDIATVIRAMTTIQSNFPLGLKYIWLVDVNWLVRPVFSAIFTQEKNQNLLDMISAQDVLTLFGRENTPTFFGGAANVASDLVGAASKAKG